MTRTKFDYIIAADCLTERLRKVGLSWNYLNRAIESKYPVIGKRLPQLFQNYSGLIDKISQIIFPYDNLMPSKRQKAAIAVKIRRAVRNEILN